MTAAISHDSPMDRLLAKLKGVKAAGKGKYMALCPAHDDNQTSLSITTGKEGRVVLYCHAQCESRDVLASVGLSMTDLFAEPRPTLTVNRPTGPVTEKAQGVETRKRHTKSYDYLTADGVLLFQVCRFEPKTFRQRRPDGAGNWVWGMGDVEPVLYRLPDVLEAVAHQRRVFIVEGEKDADALADLGYPATTSPMGAGKWKDSYAEVLAGADVVVIADNDDVGRSHAEQIAASLFARKALVKVVELPGLPDKGDVSDWLPTGDLDQLEKLIGQTPRWTPDRINGKRTRWRLDELWENDSIMRPPPPIVPRLAWAGRSTLLAAREKSGKSTLTGYIAAQVTRGGEFLGDPCASGDVLIIGLEEFLGDAARRFRHFGADATRVHLVDGFLGEPRTRPLELMGHIDAVDPVLVIIDSLAAYSNGQVQDDNNASQMSGVVQPLTDMAHSRGVALIIVHHARKADGKSRGSTAITAGTDVVCEFFCPDENADPTLRRMRTIGRVPVQPMYDIRFDGNHYTPANGLEAPLEARIIAIVGSRPGISRNDTADAVGGRRDTALKTIEDMLAKRTLGNLSDSMARAKLIVPSQSNPAFLHD